MLDSETQGYTPEQRENAERIFGDCVLNTLESMTSQIAGKSIKFSRSERDMRLIQMEKTLQLVKKKISQSKTDDDHEKKRPAGIKGLAPILAPATGRMEKFAIRNLIDRVKEGESDMAQVLNKSEIQFLSGDLRDVKNYIERGWQVGVSTALKVGGPLLYEGAHFVHLGLGTNGNLTDMSDDDYYKRIFDEQIRTGQFEDNTRRKLEFTGGWNLLLMR